MSVSITLDLATDRIITSGVSGPAGPANTLTIGTVTTVAAGGSATAALSGTAPNQILSLGVPTGATGATGAANTLTIGTVTTVATGGSATAAVSGTAPNQILSLGLPTGATGAQGSWSAAQPTRSWSTATTLVNGDAGYLVLLDGTAAINVGTALNLSVGQRIDFIVTSGTAPTIAATAPAVLNGTPTTKFRTQFSAATLLCTGTAAAGANTYVLVGDLAAS
jgi:hypothetical protein